MKMQLDWYDLVLKSYNINVGVDGNTEVTFSMRSVTQQGPQLENFSRDITLMNTIRSNNDPAVQSQWEQLLTTVALTTGRDVPDVIDSMAKTDSSNTGNKN